jgi:hypothetical protein
LGAITLSPNATRLCTLSMLASGTWHERPGAGAACASTHSSRWLVTTA